MQGRLKMQVNLSEAAARIATSVRRLAENSLVHWVD